MLAERALRVSRASLFKQLVQSTPPNVACAAEHWSQLRAAHSMTRLIWMVRRVLRLHVTLHASFAFSVRSPSSASHAARHAESAAQAGSPAQRVISS
jgi:hypothetical protein